VDDGFADASLRPHAHKQNKTRSSEHLTCCQNRTTSFALDSFCSVFRRADGSREVEDRALSSPRIRTYVRIDLPACPNHRNSDRILEAAGRGPSAGRALLPHVSGHADGDFRFRRKNVELSKGSGDPVSSFAMKVRKKRNGISFRAGGNPDPRREINVNLRGRLTPREYALFSVCRTKGPI
jgi:hypothetical protein